MDENTGTRFGGFGEVIAAARTSRTVSKLGWMTSCMVVRSVTRSNSEKHEGNCSYLWRHGCYILKLFSV